MEISVRGQRAYVYTGAQTLRPEQPSILFVHGAGADHSVWVLQSRYFAHHGCNALAIDLPGHGRSDGPPLPSVEALADWIVAFMDAAGVSNGALVGHSMGSLVALDVAARFAERVRNIALLGTSVPMPVAAPLLDAARRNEHDAFDMINIWGHSLSARLGGHPIPGLCMTGVALRLLERSAPGVLHTDLQACDDYREGLNRASLVRCPALLVLGGADFMTPPKAARQLQEILSDCSTIALDGSGHMMMSECPGPVLDALIRFLGKPS